MSEAFFFLANVLFGQALPTRLLVILTAADLVVLGFKVIFK